MCAAASARVTRLAPSPTGALHLGNARTFLINYAHAQQSGATIVLRIEDLDTPRLKPGADRGAIDLLTWLGMTWDQGPVYQTTDLSPYQNALDKLADARRAYPCRHSRKQIEQTALSAPDAVDEQHQHDARYPGLSRDRLGQRLARLGKPTPDNARLLVPDAPTTFIDRFAGAQTANVQAQVGDFLIATKAGLPSYQLAVVIDDAAQGITDIVRGDDLIPSTHRQRWLQQALALPTPDYWHVPLVLGPDGKRLAKRHGDTRLLTYRRQNVPAEKVIGLIAYWSGLLAQRRPMSTAEFVDAFAWETLPPAPVTFTPEDEDWLCSRP